MDNETPLLHLRRSRLAVSAVVVSFVGLKVEKFPGRALPRGHPRVRRSLIGGATTFSVLNGQDEERAPRAELEHANEEVEPRGRPRTTPAPAKPGGDEDGRSERRRRRRHACSGCRGRRHDCSWPQAAETDRLRQDRADQQAGRGDDRLQQPGGDRTRRRDREGGKEIADSETIAEGEDLGQRRARRRRPTPSSAPSPGIAEAGMEGTLTVDSRRSRRLVAACRARGAPRPDLLGSRPSVPCGRWASVSRHHLRVPDERARLRAHAGDARVARLRGGREPRGGRPDPLQHLLDPRVGRQPLHRPPRRGEAAQVRRPGAGRRGRRLLGAVGQGRGLPALPLRRRRLRARARSTSWPSSSTPTR